jgi:hypothetical protein
MSDVITPALNPIENNAATTLMVESPSAVEPQISERDAFAMPMEDLKKAVFDPPQQPTPKTDPQPPAQPAKAEPFTLTQDGDTFVLKYATGEVYKGANEVEVYRKAAENAVRNIEYAKQVKKLYDEFQQNPSKPVQMPDQPSTEDQQAQEAQALREFVLKGVLTPEVKAQIVAEAVGMSPEQLHQEWASMKARTDFFEQQAAIADFQKQNSSTFVDTVENEQAVMRALDTMGVKQFPNAQQLKTAWSLALLEGWGRPATPASMQSKPPRPPVMPSAGTSPIGNQNPMTMPLDELKRAAGLA